MCALSLRADIDGRDSLDGYRNRSRYYQGIAHEVLVRAVAATVMSVQGSEGDLAPSSADVRSYPESFADRTLWNVPGQTLVRKFDCAQLVQLGGYRLCALKP
jgi:hypothetical protein